MKKSHLFLSASALIAMVLGVAFFKDGFFMAFASESLELQLVRIVLAAIVMSQLITNPPRHVAHRSLTGLTALITAIGTLILFAISLNIGILDVVVFMHAAIALGITALELEQPNIIYKLPAGV